MTFVPEYLGDYPPVDGKRIGRSRYISGDGSDGRGKIRAWDVVSRPVELSIARFYGFPHFWPRLNVAQNPYLDRDENGYIWILEYGDLDLKGDSWHGAEFDSFHEAFEAAKDVYAERFNDGRHLLLFSEGVKSRMGRIEFRGRREGD